MDLVERKIFPELIDEQDLDKGKADWRSLLCTIFLLGMFIFLSGELKNISRISLGCNKALLVFPRIRGKYPRTTVKNNYLCYSVIE